MNLLDAYVTEILGDPVYVEYEGYSWWQVQVKYNSYGVFSEWRKPER